MKNLFLFSLMIVNSFCVLSQNRKLSYTKLDDNLTRYYINYENGLPELTSNKNGSVKFYLEKYIKIVDDKKLANYNLILVLNDHLMKAMNKDIFVTIVFIDYSIINARPTLENDGTYNGNITIPIKNIDRLTKTAIKSIIIQNKNDKEVEDIIFKLKKDDPGNIKFQKEALFIKNGK